MTAGHTITIVPSPAHVEVRLDGELLASTDAALRLEETGLPARYYLPRQDVRMDRLRATTFQTTCPFKGQASYWSVEAGSTEAGGTVHDGVVWSYDHPKPEVSAIAGMLSFYPDRAEVTVDGKPLA
jgi:uncharacterized protein (DUF427 family)